MDAELIDMLWILLCAGLVFLMQGGFLCLESGLTRSKNSINVAFKNVVDFGVAVALYWAVSYGLMFGSSVGGWFGNSGFFFRPTGFDAPMLFSVFIFQAMFCATGATIISGATAERLRFYAYVVITVIFSILVYPFVGHWVWASDALGEPSGWLARQGFHDFAGSSVVHSTGGWVALAVVIIVGPRLGRFNSEGKPVEIPGSNMPMAMLGTMILIFGWFGFNGGSVLGFTDGVPLIMMNTLLGAVAGMVAVMCLAPFYKKLPDPGLVMNGAIAGLVGVTANCDITGPLAAIIIGAVGGLIMLVTTRVLEHFKIDDAIGAVPAHLTPGIWGTLAAALFADPEIIGAEVDRVAMFQTQLTGVVIIGFWSFVLAFAFLWAINKKFPFRVTAEEEHAGLNISEHGARTETVFLMEDMERHARTGDLSKRVRVEPFTEVGQIAQQYNKVIDVLDLTMSRLTSIFRDLNDGIITFTKEGLLTSVNPKAAKLLGLQTASASGLDIWDVVTGSHLESVEAHQPADQEPVDVFRTGSVQEIHLKQTDTRKDIIFEFLSSEGRFADDVVYTGLIRDVSESYHTRRRRHRVMSKLFGAQKLQLYALMCKEALPEIRTAATDIQKRIVQSTLSLEDAQSLDVETMDLSLMQVSASARSIDQLTRDLQHLEEMNRLPGKPVYLDKLMEALLTDKDFRASSASLKALEIEWIPGGLDFMTQASERYLIQALRTLFRYAALQNTPGTPLELSTKPVYLDQPFHGSEMVPVGEYMVLTLQDTGKGLTEDQVDKLFASGKDDSNFPMVLAEAIVHYMSGYLLVDSTLGKGTEFSIYLPLARPPVSIITDIPSPKASVLVVDDDMQQLNQLASTLRQEKFRVVSAESEKEAVEMLKTEKVDLVLLDLVLGRDARPDAGVFHRLRKAYPDLPILVTCGNPDKEVLADVIQDGAAGYVSKPFVATTLVRQVSKETASKLAAV
ncbi:MAG: ammonium transporter [Verrucomicrobia bacterium]|nr:ammonium transporter [Verrucomicrobiota bacterium]MCH8526432.1 ammonium transporter [Kiritimatiellia bacterium]